MGTLVIIHLFHQEKIMASVKGKQSWTLAKAARADFNQ